MKWLRRHAPCYLGRQWSEKAKGSCSCFHRSWQSCARDVLSVGNFTIACCFRLCLLFAAGCFEFTLDLAIYANHFDTTYQHDNYDSAVPSWWDDIADQKSPIIPLLFEMEECLTIETVNKKHSLLSTAVRTVPGTVVQIMIKWIFDHLLGFSIQPIKDPFCYVSYYCSHSNQKTFEIRRFTSRKQIK